jgi:hypothetical protein
MPNKKSLNRNLNRAQMCARMITNAGFVASISITRPCEDHPKGIIFSDKDLIALDFPDNDAMVLPLRISTLDIFRVLIESRILVIIYYKL